MASREALLETMATVERAHACGFDERVRRGGLERIAERYRRERDEARQRSADLSMQFAAYQYEARTRIGWLERQILDMRKERVVESVSAPPTPEPAAALPPVPARPARGSTTDSRSGRSRVAGYKAPLDNTPEFLASVQELMSRPVPQDPAAFDRTIDQEEVG